jgi:DMSO reductase family type II enzyme molybdopterin subunit
MHEPSTTDASDADRGRGTTTEAAYRDRAGGPWDRVVKVSHCVDCLPGSCSLNAFVRDGVVVREESSGDIPVVEPGVPDMNPLVCQKGLAWSRQLRSPDRLLHPMRRVGERGSGRWERISWDEALEEVAEAILDAIEEIGPESVVQEGSPEIGMVAPAMRFGTAMGATVLDVNGSINDFWAGFHQVYGKFYPAYSYDDLFHSDTIFIWHANPAFTMIPVFHYIPEARYRGAQVVLVAPDVSPSHTHADVHAPVRPGTDAALALAMCQVVLAEGLLDTDFVATQTDLPLLVRTDDGRFLRDSDLVEDGREDRFLLATTEDGPTPADPGDLLANSRAGTVALEGRWSVALHDGTEVEVEPLLAVLRRQLDRDHTPEQASGICGVEPGTIRTLARLAAHGRTHVMVPGGMSKYFHGDLIARSVLLLLGLTGNWGRKGAGIGGWATGLFDGHLLAMSKPAPGVEGAATVVEMMDTARTMMLAADDTLTPELATVQMLRMLTSGMGMVPPAFFWYRHAGFAERMDDPALVTGGLRSFGDYLEEATSKGWWRGVDGPDDEHPPRVLVEVAGNMLRRTRGGKTVLLEKLWPQLTKVVVIDIRMSETARYADIVLPAAGSYEKAGFGMQTPWTMTLAFSDAAVEPPGEARGEWWMLTELLETLARRAAARGLESYRDAAGTQRRYDELAGKFTFGGAIRDEEDLADEMIRDAEMIGNLPAGTSLDTLRRDGFTRYADWGMMAMAQGQASPFPEGETHVPLRNHVELGHPYPTLTRRAQFLLDHPWFMAAGESLPVHKEPPPLGGADHPFQLSSGHNRWSIHAMNTTNPVLLETHRGKPFVLINADDAAEAGVEDDRDVTIWNDHGSFTVAARTSHAQRPGALTVYNGFEGFMFPGGDGPNEVEPGVVKPLGLADGYGHLTYSPTEWQPIPADRCVGVSIAPAGGTAG